MTETNSDSCRYRTWYLLVPIIAAIIVYGRALDLFFVWDDFIWVDRGRTLLMTPGQMFAVDVMYFDPIVHLLFWIQYAIAGTTAWVYHLANLCLHVTTTVLLFRLARNISGGDNLLATMAATVFAVTVTVTDAVVWASSAVDLLAVMFTLTAIHFFLAFLQSSLRSHLLFSVFAFCAALASKGTPVVLPAILAVLVAAQPGRKRAWTSLIPFTAIAIAYLAAVRLVTGGSSTGMAATTGINVKNFFLGLTALMAPERIMVHAWYLWFVVTLILAIVGIVIVARSGMDRRPMFLSLAIAIFATAPLAVLKDISLVGPSTSEVLLLSSPSHRLYLASAGVALFIASVLRCIFIHARTQGWQQGLLAVTALMFIGWNFYEVGERLTKWRGAANVVQKEVESLSPFKQEIQKDSPIGLVGFTMSRGFIQPMLATWFDAGETTVLPIITVPENVPDEPTLLSRWNKASLFVRKNGKTFSLSSNFQSLLSAAVRHNLARTEIEKVKTRTEYLQGVERINSAIVLR